MMCTWVCVWTLHTKRIQRRPAGHISRNCKIQIILYKDKPSKGGWGETTKKKNWIYVCTIECKCIYVSVCTAHMRCVCMWWCVSIFEISSTFSYILSYRNVKPLKIGGQLMAFKASTRRAVHATRGNKIKIDQASPSIMIADLHSSISKEPETGGGEKRSPWLPDGEM